MTGRGRARRDGGDQRARRNGKKWDMDVESKEGGGKEGKERGRENN